MAWDHGIYRIAAVVAVCLIVLCLSTSTGRDRRGYEVETQVYGVPTAQSDAARAIDAYERLMERHMDLTERSLLGFAADLKALSTKSDAVDAKLTALDAKMSQVDQRLARIEKHLGITTAPPKASAKADPNAPATVKRPAGNPPLTPQ
jgi:septal ring factor EnvC (AmiA/AmiB activator)